MIPSAVARILDANFNRAREALRVMEDHARFVRDDPAGCEAVKRMRHDLATAVSRLPADCLLSARDTPGDVGTRITTDTERQRGQADDVLIAAAKRLPEALRTLEEYGKTVDAEFASAMEALRYRAYEVEQRLMLRGDRCARFARTRLYVLITESLCRGDWLQTAETAIDGGADCLQLREKGLNDSELLRRARLLTAICRKLGVLFIINDRPDIAVLADADGVHLGRADMSVADARRIIGPGRLIGVSTHTPEQFRAAACKTTFASDSTGPGGTAALGCDSSGAALPDYIAVGPMFASSTKPQDHVPGPDLLILAQRETGIPIVPIGGITLDTVPQLTATGAQRICVCAAVIAQDDPRAAAVALLQSIHPAEVRERM